MHAGRIAALLIAAALVPGVARADESDEKAAASDAKRIAFLREALARDASASRTWLLVWAGTYTLTTAGEAIVSVTASDPGLRGDARVDAVKSAIGWLSVFALPPPSLRTPAFLPPNPTPDQRAAFIAAEEKRLDDAADWERFGRSWLAHVGVAAVNLGGGAYLWLHDDRAVSALVTTLVGIGVGELQIWTTPTHAIGAQRAYRELRASVAPQVGKSGGGVAVTLGF